MSLHVGNKKPFHLHKVSGIKELVQFYIVDKILKFNFNLFLQEEILRY